MQVGNFGQVGIANGVSLRGWPGANDSSAVAFYLDGVQRNEASGTGANGYLDINPLIPEVLNQLTVVKGPFDTRYGGNFALAGSAVATTADYLPTSLSVTAGLYERASVLGIVGYRNDAMTYYSSIEGLHDEGYGRNGQQSKLSTFSKFGMNVGGARVSLSLQTYNLTYGSPGYLDLENILSGLISPGSDVSHTDGGSKDEYTVTARYLRGDAEQGVDVTAYADYEKRHRFATFTPYPQTRTSDDRTFYGASVEPHKRFGLLRSGDLDVMVGASVRHDIIKTTQLPSMNGNPIWTPDPLDIYGYHQADIGHTQASGYGAATFKPANWIKLMAGARYDWFNYDINNQAYVPASNSFANEVISPSTGQFSPKGGIAIQPLRDFTIFANIGRSLTSPDAGRELLGNPNLKCSILLTKEAGASFNSQDAHIHLQASYYTTKFSNEITFVGLTPVNQGETIRKGYDLETSALAVRTDRLAMRVYGNYSHIDGRLESGGPIPNVATWVASYGLHADITRSGTSDVIQADVGQQWTGPQALDAPETHSSPSSSRVAVRLSYQMAERHRLRLWTDAIVYPSNNGRFNEFGFVLAGRVYVASLPRVQWTAGVAMDFE